MERFISIVSIQKQKDSAYMISIPHRIVKELNLQRKQELTVLLDGNRIIYRVGGA